MPIVFEYIIMECFRIRFDIEFSEELCQSDSYSNRIANKAFRDLNFGINLGSVTYKDGDGAPNRYPRFFSSVIK